MSYVSVPAHWPSAGAIRAGQKPVPSVAGPSCAACQDGGVTITLRAGRAADIAGLLAMWQEAAENESRPPDTRAALAALLGRDPDALILAEDDGVLIGSVIAGWDGWRFHLYRLAVHPAYRRRGVGSALLRAAEDKARAHGVTRIDAMVLDANETGQQLWRARGYRKQGNWRRWLKGL